MQVEAASAQPLVGGVFSCVIPVRWGDLDALNHVNNAVFFRYQDEVRVRLFSLAGIKMPSDRNVVLAHASCDFLRPILFPSTVVVSMELARIGRSSIEVQVQITCHDDPTIIYAKGRNVIVAFDALTGKSTEWKQSELASFAKCFQAPVVN